MRNVKGVFADVRAGVKEHLHGSSGGGGRMGEGEKRKGITLEI